MDYPWGHTRRFNAYANYLKARFGGRLQKVSVNAGFTCPNRDGTVAQGGCTYCDNEAFSPTYCQPDMSVYDQIAAGIRFHKTRYKHVSQYLAYFQSYSNTYASLEYLKGIYAQAMAHPEVVGLVIGTRPDCIDEEKMAYFAELSEKMYIIIEYGVESCYDKTLSRINRGHSFEDAVQAIELTHRFGVHSGAHMIIGLPGESHEEILKQAAILSSLPLNTLKFHQLQIMKGTAMEADYLSNSHDFHFFDSDAYLEFMVTFVEQLNPAIVIERIAGESHPTRNITPVQWGLRNDQVVQLFEKKLALLDTWQGKKYHPHGFH